MNRVKFNVTRDAAMIARHEQLVAQLKQNPDVIHFLQNNHLDDSIFENYSGKLRKWSQARRECRICTGLCQCKNVPKGMFYNLTVDEQGNLGENLKSCRYQDEKNARMRHKQNFVYSDLTEQDYLRDSAWIQASPVIRQAEYFNCYKKMVASLSEAGGYYIYGQPGTGKTTMLAAFANEYAKQGLKTAFVRVPLLISRLKASLKDEEWRREVMHILTTVPVLFLDDFGSESATAWTRDEILFPILDERMNRGLKTYFGSNLTIDELAKRYTFGNEGFSSVPARRLLERIRTLARPLGLEGASRRKPME